MIWHTIDSYNGAGTSTKGFVVPTQRQTSKDFSRPSYGGGWYLSDEVHSWFLSRGIEYKIDWNFIAEKCWSVGVEDPKDAMLVKLTWS